MPPHVYVGIPTRNRPRYVREALASVRAQTYPHLRIVVTDNASDPEFAADVRSHVEELGDSRVSYVMNSFPDGERGQTLYNFACCHEPYFVLVHDDDRLQPTLVARAVAALEANPRVAFFSTTQNLIDGRGALLADDTARYNAWLKRDRMSSGVVDDVLTTILTAGVFSMSGTVFRREPMARVGFVDPDGGGFPIDMITFLRLGERGEKGYFLNEPLTDYRWHPGQSRVKHRNWTFTEWMIARYVAQFEQRRFTGRAERLRRRLLCLGLCRLALVRHVAGHGQEARALLRRAIAVSPETWQAWAYCLIGHLLPFTIAPAWGDRVTLGANPP